MKNKYLAEMNRVFTAEQGRIGSIMRKAFKEYIKPIDTTATIHVYDTNYFIPPERVRYEIKGNHPIEYTFCFNQPFRPWIKLEKAFTYQSLKDIAVETGELTDEIDIFDNELRHGLDHILGGNILKANGANNNYEDVRIYEENKQGFNEIINGTEELFQQAITDFVAVHDNLINFLKNNERVRKIIFCSEDNLLEIKPLVFYEKPANQEVKELETRMERLYQKCIGRNGVNPYFDHSLRL